MTSFLAPTELAALAEGNEARAYEALVTAAGVPGFKVVRQSDACVRLLASAAPSMLVFNRVIGWGVDGAADEPSLERVRSAYGDAGFGIELAPPAARPEVLAWLKAQRFRRVPASQVLVYEGGAPPPQRYDSWSRGTGLRVEPVGPEHAATVAAISRENFKFPASMAEALAKGIGGPGWRRWLVFDGKQAVGASLSYVCGDVAWFGWTSALPSHRGRWIHVGVVARQMAEAAAAGCRWVSTETAVSTHERPDPVYLNLRRFGFADAYLRPLYVRAPVRRKG